MVVASWKLAVASWKLAVASRPEAIATRKTGVAGRPNAVATLPKGVAANSPNPTGFQFLTHRLTVRVVAAHSRHADECFRRRITSLLSVARDRVLSRWFLPHRAGGSRAAHGVLSGHPAVSRIPGAPG